MRLFYLHLLLFWIQLFERLIAVDITTCLHFIIFLHCYSPFSDSIGHSYKSVARLTYSNKIELNTYVCLNGSNSYCFYSINYQLKYNTTYHFHTQFNCNINCPISSTTVLNLYTISAGMIIVYHSKNNTW